MTGFERREGVLHAEGVSLEDLAREFGTPLYVYSTGVARRAYEAYAAAFAAVPHRICYALKANSTRAVLEVFKEMGAGADVVSGGELLAALRAGFRGEDVVFAGVGKTREELRLGLARGVGCFNVESEAELRLLAEEARHAGQQARVSLRVNPDVDARSHPYISTGLKQNKFGVDIDEGARILNGTRGWPSLHVAGLHCHIGSQLTELDPIEEAVRGLVELSRRLLADGFELDTIDLGGGLGVDYEGRGVPGPAQLAKRVLPLLSELPLTVLLEPGRSLVGPAGVLLTRVTYVKINRGRCFVIVDAGMNDLLRPALYDAHHAVAPVVERGRETVLVDVVGPVCETADCLARGRRLEGVEAGELLAVRDAGAYGFSMASSYNMRPRPAEVLVSDGRARLIRRRETFEDLVACEV